MASIRVITSGSKDTCDSPNIAKVDKDKNHSHKDVLEWFVKFTSIGGFTQTRDADNWLSKVIWALLFLTGLILTIVGVVSVITNYFKYGSITNIQLKHSSSGMVFPAVTVCNTNRIHCGHLYNKIISCGSVCFRQNISIYNYTWFNIIKQQ